MTPVALQQNPLESEGLLVDKDKNSADMKADLEAGVDDVDLDSTKSSSKSDADLIGDGKNDPSKEDKREKYSGSRCASRAFATVGVLLFVGAAAFGVFYFKDDIEKLLNRQSLGSAATRSSETNGTDVLANSSAFSLDTYPPNVTLTPIFQPSELTPTLTPEMVEMTTPEPSITSSPAATEPVTSEPSATSAPTTASHVTSTDTTSPSATSPNVLDTPTPAPTLPKNDNAGNTTNATTPAAVALTDTTEAMNTSFAPNTTYLSTPAMTSRSTFRAAPTPSTTPEPTSTTLEPMTDSPEFSTNATAFPKQLVTENATNTTSGRFDIDALWENLEQPSVTTSAAINTVEALSTPSVADNEQRGSLTSGDTAAFP
ncbi:hypothetical protein DYB32_004115 [Aphanomyces invadans]|uniref:Uncharacterized protein n=1 Tax=Aphanomyces invadans TaxID=157072 RepID=A0A3R7AAR5_9STRA|nr:hypothetical protein DYB32_004115 [Aphanomyces invadans]